MGWPREAMEPHAMTEHWYRTFHGTPNDPKFRVIASRASHTMSHQVTTATVLALWWVVLDCASQSAPRGNIDNLNNEDTAVTLQVDEAVIVAIRQAMQGKTLDGNRVISWDKRQPKREREDTTAAERKAAQRAREAVAIPGVTLESHTESHHVTPCPAQRRGEERREERALSVGNPEKLDSREPDPPPSAPLAQQMGTPAGEAAKALKTAGVFHVNPSNPKLLALLAQGVTAAELTDAAKEAISKGKTGLAYVLALVEGQRRDAAAGGTLPGRKPEQRGGSRPLYRGEHKRRTDPNAPAPKALTDILQGMGILPKQEPAP